MTAAELTRLYLDDSAYQTKQVFAGLAESDADAKLTERAMSPRETLIHLTDCLFACQESLKGNHEYAWGSYNPDDKSLSGLMAAFEAERAKVAEAVGARGDDEAALKSAQAYVAAHEFYHVGQMALLRLKVTPDWDAYSIYR